MFYKIIVLLFISNLVIISGQQEESSDEKKLQEQYDSLKSQLNCTEVPTKWCNLNNQTDSGCAQGYVCHDIGIQDFKVGRCYRDPQSCLPENSSCCDTTDCCRQVSETNTAPLDCVQTYDNKLICKVLVV